MLAGTWSSHDIHTLRVRAQLGTIVSENDSAVSMKSKHRCILWASSSIPSHTSNRNTYLSSRRDMYKNSERHISSSQKIKTHIFINGSIFTMENQRALRKNKLQWHVTMCMNLENTKLNEGNQTQKDGRMYDFICKSFENRQNESMKSEVRIIFEG